MILAMRDLVEEKNQIVKFHSRRSDFDRRIQSKSDLQINFPSTNLMKDVVLRPNLDLRYFWDIIRCLSLFCR